MTTSAPYRSFTYPEDLKRHSLVCVTGKQEWLICDGICLGVRARETGDWLEDHFAVDERVHMVPAKRGPDGSMRWNLQVFSFGMTLQRGPVLEVRAADASLALRLPGPHNRLRKAATSSRLN